MREHAALKQKWNEVRICIPCTEGVPICTVCQKLQATCMNNLQAWSFDQVLCLSIHSMHRWKQL